jgi:hypothetical protein
MQEKPPKKVRVLVTRPPRERVGARRTGCEGPVSAARFAGKRRRREDRAPGNWHEDGTADRIGAAGGNGAGGGGFGPRTASSVESLPRESPPR